MDWFADAMALSTCASAWPEQNAISIPLLGRAGAGQQRDRAALLKADRYSR